VTTLDMTKAQEAQLWMQRLFEAEGGMNRFLVDRSLMKYLSEWMAVRKRIFGGLPVEREDDARAWQSAFFKGQALLEEFITARYGQAAMEEWATANAEIHRLVEPDAGGGATDPITRIARQAHLYSSRYEITEAGREQAELVIDHCSIWDYRERARARGVPITLASPCTYCTKSMSANVRAKGFVPRYELFETDGGHGCRWRANSPDTA
jgi:hypothetical protein